MSHRDTTCLLCGHVGHEVSMALIAWKVPVGRDRFTSAPRCPDHDACRARVEANGDQWEVWERPMTTRELLEANRV